MSDPTQTHTSRDGAADWSNYWQGRAATESGAALVGVGVETSQELATLWSRELEGADGPLLDIACGAGTVLRTAAALDISPLHGVDISDDALTALARELPDARTSVADAAALPFADGSFATVTSQFGIEYADRKAFGEARRILAPSGRLVLVCHHANGAIAAEVRGKRDAADALDRTGFTELAKAVFAASDSEFETAAKCFGPAQDAVMAMAKGGDRLAAHLYGGTQTLYERRANYAPQDITAWFDSMNAEVEAFRGRMQSMLDAAMTDDDARSVAANLSATVESVQLGGADAAWLIRAERDTIS